MPVDTDAKTLGGNGRPSNVIPGGGRVEALARLGDEALLALVSSAALPSRRALRAWLVDPAAEGAQKLDGWRISLERGGRNPGLALLLLQPASRGERLRPEGQLVLDVEERAVSLEPADVARATVGLEALGKSHLVALEPGDRLALLDELVGRLGRRRTGIRAVAADLCVLRDAARPRFPAAEVNAEAAVAAQVDSIHRIDESAFYVEGWVIDRTGTLATIRLITPEGRSIEIAESAFRYPRPDVSGLFGVPEGDDLGFIAYVEAPEKTVVPSGWVLQAELADGAGVEVGMPPVSDDPKALRTIVLGDIELDRPGDRLKTEHMKPALERLEERLRGSVEIETVEQHGEPPADPAVSIVVPLYKRTDYVEHQLAQFVHDPEIARADLIYVLDSPEDAPQLRRFAAHLYALYGVPFRLACLSANGGFSVVNNLGASLARGRHLLLLNSDVLPSQPGWLSRLVEFYESNPTIGALAPKLLYEDDSIQHAGLYFDRPPGAETWSNEHFFKGLSRDFPGANVAQAVPAVTGACLLIDLDLWREMGGLQGGYVRGDYEDSDLCLRLQQAGRESWYLPDVELYHLEGQSYPSIERAAASRFNQWLQTAAWQDQLSAWG
jgi:GT2 family glycosyltransferase